MLKTTSLSRRTTSLSPSIRNIVYYDQFGWRNCYFVLAFFLSSVVVLLLVHEQPQPQQQQQQQQQQSGIIFSNDDGQQHRRNKKSKNTMFSFSSFMVMAQEEEEEEESSSSSPPPPVYGVDVSYPMHYAPPSVNYAWLPHNIDPENNPITPEEYEGMVIQPLGDMKAKYDEYINGCVEYYNNKGKDGNICRTNEEERLEMSLRQPKSVYNYTQLGYTKIRAPEHVFSLIKDFWDKNKDNGKEEKWFTGNIYTNHWISPTSIVSVEDTSLDGGGYVLKQHIWNAARDTIEEWTGYRQAECSLYGIRVYHNGSMLAPHVDRLPLVSSAIINVDQDVDEPWPLEVIGHDGIAVNITMVPGDLVLYESHSILHSRPFPLNGRYMANVFIHFEPIGPIGGQIQYDGDLPPYVIPGSEEEDNWRLRNPDGHSIMGDSTFTTGSTEAHENAKRGLIDELEIVLDKHADLINIRDQNGWTPLHEAIRYGDVGLVTLLLDRGAEMNARTGSNEQGGSALNMAKDMLGINDPVVTLLQSRGAKDYPPQRRTTSMKQDL